MAGLWWPCVPGGVSLALPQGLRGLRGDAPGEVGTDKGLRGDSVGREAASRDPSLTTQGGMPNSQGPSPPAASRVPPGLGAATVSREEGL